MEDGRRWIKEKDDEGEDEDEDEEGEEKRTFFVHSLFPLFSNVNDNH